MSDDLMKQLSSYKAQLQQVEAALSTDQENEDLMKLQKDLQVKHDTDQDAICLYYLYWHQLHPD